MIQFNSVNGLANAPLAQKQQAIQDGSFKIGNKTYNVDVTNQEVISRPSMFASCLGGLFSSNTPDPNLVTITQNLFFDPNQRPVDIANLIQTKLTTQNAQDLSLIVGQPAVANMLNDAANYYGFNDRANLSMQNLDGVFDELLNLDNRMATLRNNHVTNTLLPNIQNNQFANTILNQNDYGGQNYNTTHEKAAAWIVSKSNSIGKGNDFAQEVQRISDIIQANMNTDLTNINNIEQLHETILGDAADRLASFRRPEMVGTAPNHNGYTSNSIGHQLLSQHLGQLGNPPEPKAIFGIVTGDHGFVDGNGRLARVAYAIAALQNNANNFAAPDLAAEKLLHGLP
ncbi:MAG: hypothetical protein AAGB12_14645 [Pseudomonadota bacterium]